MNFFFSIEHHLVSNQRFKMDADNEALYIFCKKKLKHTCESKH